MDCIICLKNPAGSLEHVVPLALGGSLTIASVCKHCNDHLGHAIDSPLINHPLVAIQRSTYRLAGNSGQVPDALKVLMGRSGALGETGQKVRLERDSDGKYRSRLIFDRRETVAEDGSITISVSLDPAEAHRLPDIINANLRRHGKSPLTDEELAEAVAQAMGSVQKIERPTIRGTATINLLSWRPGLLKVAYEMAAFWFGDTFLQTAEASAMREILLNGRDLDASAINACFSFRVEGLLARLAGKAEHVVFSFVAAGRIKIVVCLFAQFAAVVDVGPVGRLKHGHFVRMDVVRRSYVTSTFAREVNQLRRRDRWRRLRSTTALASLPRIAQRD